MARARARRPASCPSLPPRSARWRKRRPPGRNRSQEPFSSQIMTGTPPSPAKRERVGERAVGAEARATNKRIFVYSPILLPHGDLRDSTQIGSDPPAPGGAG